MLELLPIFGLIFGPIIGALILGFIQLGIYKLLALMRIMDGENIPMFPILLFRGLLMLLALIALGGFASFYFKDGEDPLMNKRPEQPFPETIISTVYLPEYRA